ncbi:MAG: glycosyltransferase family 1 protein [Chitinophagaceae bacterium]|nr:MAG: glycosyltransferase family 1 protein [Chitinophagaceae bacterium]
MSTIAFDAKRAFHNGTGLGNYSRTLIRGLATGYPQHHYLLLNPKPGKHYHKPALPNVEEIRPTGVLGKALPGAWRSRWVSGELKGLGADLYHGLSHEIPVGIGATGIPSVVTMHDLIFERYPHQYKKIDRAIYRRKFLYACNNATRIIAISEQTKRDLVAIYGADAARIDVCYQSCDPAFAERASEAVREDIRRRYHLPERFLLYVGSLIERKNLLGICKALDALRKEGLPPLLVVGGGGAYAQLVKDFLREKGLQDRVRFLSEEAAVTSDPRFREPATLAAIYQMADTMLYPSFFEGFGIPVLEALWSRVPVITSNASCLPEAAGPGGCYVDPGSPESIAEAILKLRRDPALAASLVEQGWAHAQNFTLERCSASVMQVYEKVWKTNSSTPR